MSSNNFLENTPRRHYSRKTIIDHLKKLCDEFMNSDEFNEEAIKCRISGYHGFEYKKISTTITAFTKYGVKYTNGQSGYTYNIKNNDNNSNVSYNGCSWKILASTNELKFTFRFNAGFWNCDKCLTSYIYCVHGPLCCLNFCC